MDLVKITERFCKDIEKLSFSPPVAFVYNPLKYAAAPYHKYLKQYGAQPKKTVLLGMNPGPWGMAQTGIPFGEVTLVKEWLRINEKVGRPVVEHPKKIVLGFNCQRSEVSGKRLWGWAKERFGEAEIFFAQFFVANYCPLLFMEEGGRNLTPDKISKKDRQVLYEICDKYLYLTMKEINPEYVIGVGRFAEDRLKHALRNLDIKIGVITHPSPANPKANKGWKALVEKELSDYGLLSAS